MKKYVLFDHDGVLVDTELWYFTAGQQALAEIGIRLDLEQYLRDMSDGAGTWAQARAGDVDEATIDRARIRRDALYQEFLRTEPIEIDGVLAVLEALAPHVRMAIVTTAKPVDFQLIHRDRAITAYMDFVLMRDDYTYAKPHPEPYLTALDRFGASPAEAIVVEDSERGLRSAVAAGIDCAVVANEFTATQDFSTATHRLDSLHDLVPLVTGST